jgi:hypothetical protein
MRVLLLLFITAVCVCLLLQYLLQTACADNGAEKRRVLIVSVLLSVALNFALRSKTQRRIEVLGMR